MWEAIFAILFKDKKRDKSEQLMGNEGSSFAADDDDDIDDIDEYAALARKNRMINFAEARVLEIILEKVFEKRWSTDVEGIEASIDYALTEIGSRVNSSWRNVPKRISPHSFGLYVQWDGRHESGTYAKLGINRYEVVDTDTLLHIAMRIDRCDLLLRCLSKCSALQLDKQNEQGETAASINPEKFARFFGVQATSEEAPTSVFTTVPDGMDSDLKSAVDKLRSERGMSIAETKQRMEEGRRRDEAKPALRAEFRRRELEEKRKKEESKRAVWHIDGEEVDAYTRSILEDAHQSGQTCLSSRRTDTSGYFDYDLQNGIAVFTDDMGHRGREQKLIRQIKDTSEI